MTGRRSSGHYAKFCHLSADAEPRVTAMMPKRTRIGAHNLALSIIAKFSPKLL
jgi:hypothetical protein